MNLVAEERAPGAAPIGKDELKALIGELLERLDAEGTAGEPVAGGEAGGAARRVLIIPPDITRLHSRSGEICALVHDAWKGRIAAILPATGTHASMTADEIGAMFPGVPPALFRSRDYRTDCVELGRVGNDSVRALSEGELDFDFPVQVDRILIEGGFDLVISVGQVVPHEVVGMANHNKNVLVGCGGKEAIDKSHFLGAVYGMERIMGRADTPVRALLDAAEEVASPRLPPVCYVQTVVDARGLVGIFAGFGKDCFRAAAALSARVNVQALPSPIARAVCWMPPAEYRSTWLACKAIYRTRMAMADGGELLIIAPALRHFGENAAIDALIGQHGYRGRDEVLRRFAADAELGANMAVAAHLIHGSTEGRFRATWAGPAEFAPRLEAAGFRAIPLAAAMERYAPEGKSTGAYRDADGDYFFIDNPGTGLWMAGRD